MVPVNKVGATGNGLTVTVVPFDASELQLPLVTVTEYVPEAETVIDCVVAPFDQRFPVAEEDVNTTLLPEQNVIGPPAVIVGVTGSAVTVTIFGVELREEQVPLVTDTV